MNAYRPVLQRMTEDLRLRGLSPNTIKVYTRFARTFLEFYGGPVAQLDVQDIRRFLLVLIQEKGRSPRTVNVYNAAIRFLFAVTLNRTFNPIQIPRQKTPKPLPQVLTRQEIVTLLEGCHHVKYRALFALIYGSGLRVSEAAALKIEHIDSDTMRVLVRQGKGAKDRYTLLSSKALDLLREYWKTCRPKHPEGWLFLGPDKQSRISPNAISRAFRSSCTRVRIARDVSIHSLRHSFATHLLEDGVSLFHIKELLGHSNIRSTMVYLHLTNVAHGVHSPLDSLFVGDKTGVGAHA